jgi:arylsulfatase A-like enzyme
MGCNLKVTLIIIVCCLVGCSTPEDAEETVLITKGEKLSVLLIVVDTLRADHLGCYGYDQSTSPAIDRFAQEAVVYESAIAAAPLTMPSMAGMLSGYYPDRTGVVNHSPADALEGTIPTMAEVFQSNGYKTAAVVSNAWLASPRKGFDRGFETFLTTRKLKTGLGAKSLTDQAIGLIDSFEDEPFFLWLHYLDPHMPYRPPQELAQIFGNDDGNSRIIQAFRTQKNSAQSIYFSQAHQPEDVTATRQLYDACIRFVDFHIERLLASLSHRGLSEDLLVILTADHGEALGDHGLYFAHDHNVYQELVRVPLMIRAPGIASRRISSDVSLIDIMPSLCQWLSLDSCAGSDGQVLPLTSDHQRRDRVVFSASAPYRERYHLNPRIYVPGIDGRWTMALKNGKKLIKIPHPQHTILEAYDLRADPTELNQLEPESSGFQLLMAELRQWEEGVKQDRLKPRSGVGAIDAETKQQLQSLGYLRSVE